MHSLNITSLTHAQLKKLSHNLPNLSMVNYDLLKEHIQQIDENYFFSIHVWLSAYCSAEYCHGHYSYCYALLLQVQKNHE